MEIDMKEFLSKTEEEKIELLSVQKGTLHLIPNQDFNSEDREKWENFCKEKGITFTDIQLKSKQK